MPVYYKWTSAIKQTHLRHDYPSLEINNHPLKVEVLNVKLSANKSFIESLQKWSSPFEELDPLLRFEQLNVDNDTGPDEKCENTINYPKVWNGKRTAILNKYTTGEKLTIVSSFLPGGEKISSFSALLRQVSNLNEKVKHRLEQLDDFDESSVRKTMGLSQQEFVTKIHMLDDEIKKAWDSEQRVKAFKIAIQCSKLLSDINVMQFYPSKFVLISDVLGNFGALVFDRLKRKSFGNVDLKIHDIDSNSVPESARETCQNWMFKMASIRELLPRLYMEMSLLKCYAFISKSEIKPAIERLTRMIRGIGNPLVAIYVRVYLCNMASNLYGEESECYFNDNLKEFLEEYQQIFCPNMAKKFGTQLLTADQYLSLYIPAVEWLLYGTLNHTKCKLSLLEEMLQKCETTENSELLLCCCVSAFDSPTVIKKSSAILEIIRNQCDHMVLVSQILASVGEHLCHAENYCQLSSEGLSQTWWKIATNMKSTADFLQVLEPWLQFACTQLSTQHINMILRGTIRYMIKCGKPADEYCSQIQTLTKRMLKSIPDVEELFLMDAFMPLVELVQTSNARSVMAKTVLTIFFERYNSVQIEDHIIISSLMRLCCILHDSINAVTVEDESKVCAELINKFIHAVSYHDDLEQQLNFYVECRSAFIKLDSVLIALVHAVNALAARADMSRGRWLQRACAAYCFVTVPSLQCPLTKAQLYLLGGQVALLNCCIGQAEANLKTLVGLIPEVPQFVQEDGQNKSTHDKLVGLLSNFLSTLLILPDNMDSNSKAYILSGFIKTMERIHWRKTDPLYYTLLLRTLDLLCQMTQETYAYHIDGVLSNDELYGTEEEFVEAIENHATNICQELLVVLKSLGDAKETKKQYNLALELFWRIVRRGKLQEGPMTNLAANLWVLAHKIQDSNNRFAALLSVLEKDQNVECRRLFDKININ
ncbi:VPS35 endosomal protein-sorting factor-like isoform X2 [Maniola hyperantus]|uniref:VPS35 endosomal protein-sorting factor-like isoform X2 n=1 Tax=Aphantopus hyperantus TaxID=2795564 RepID=UPI0015694053|nr:VPS35 endosomal protein sorting factor-like isoform X2 [Maniola hyperantus]